MEKRREKRENMKKKKKKQDKRQNKKERRNKKEEKRKEGPRDGPKKLFFTSEMLRDRNEIEEKLEKMKNKKRKNMFSMFFSLSFFLFFFSFLVSLPPLLVWPLLLKGLPWLGRLPLLVGDPPSLLLVGGRSLLGLGFSLATFGGTVSPDPFFPPGCFAVSPPLLVGRGWAGRPLLPSPFRLGGLHLPFLIPCFWLGGLPSLLACGHPPPLWLGGLPPLGVSPLVVWPSPLPYWEREEGEGGRGCTFRPSGPFLDQFKCNSKVQTNFWMFWCYFSVFLCLGNPFRDGFAEKTDFWIWMFLCGFFCVLFLDPRRGRFTCNCSFSGTT